MEQIGGKTFASQFLSISKVETTFERLVLAIKNRERVDLLKSIPSNVEELQQKDENNKNLLFYALYEKNSQALLFLLIKGLNYGQKDSENKNLYHFCGYSGSINCLKVLRQYIKIQKVRKLNEEYLGILKRCNYKRTDMKNGQLKYGVSPKRQQVFYEMREQLTRLYENYFKDYLQTLLNDLKEVDEVNRRNPLHLVCLNKYQKCLSVLQEFISQIYCPDLRLTNDITSQYTSTNAHLEQKEKIDPRLYEDTLSLIYQVLLPEVRQKIWREYENEAKKGIHQLLNSRDKDEHTPLYISSKNGSTAMINMLKKYELKPKREEQQQIMKVASNNLARSHIIDLCQASKFSDTKPLNFLLACGEEVNKKKTIFGTFALLEAVKSFSSQKSVEPIKVLFKSGADPNEQDTNGWTVLHHACQSGDKEVVELLIRERQTIKLNVNVFTNKRYHALHLAAQNNHPDIIRCLLGQESLKLNIDVRDWSQCTPLHHAARKGCVQSLKTLLSLNANIYAVDIQKMTALHLAASGNHGNCLKELLLADSNSDQLRDMRNSKGKMAKDLWNSTKVFQNIFTASRRGDVNTVRKLVTQQPGLKDSVTPVKERTPLILAILAKSLISVKFLIQIEADRQHVDKEGKNGLEYAKEMLQELKKKGKLKKEEKQEEGALQKIISLLNS